MAEFSLRNRRGEVVAVALVDDIDLPLVETTRWSLMSTGYVQGWRDKQYTLLHRYLLGLRPGDGLQGDHRNRNKLDNRRSNLRIVTPAQNSQNVPRLRGGAYSFRGRWQARVKLLGRIYNLGTYDTEEEARAVAALFRQEHMPFAA